jgi:hypothetical protein
MSPMSPPISEWAGMNGLSVRGHGLEMTMEHIPQVPSAVGARMAGLASLWHGGGLVAGRGLCWAWPVFLDSGRPAALRHVDSRK